MRRVLLDVQYEDIRASVWVREGSVLEFPYHHTLPAWRNPLTGVGADEHTVYASVTLEVLRIDPVTKLVHVEASKDPLHHGYPLHARLGKRDSADVVGIDRLFYLESPPKSSPTARVRVVKLELR